MYDKNMASKDIADALGVEKGWVEEVIKKHTSDDEDGEKLGSMYEILEAIIREVSGTKKIKAIIRNFKSFDPDNLEKLAELLSMAEISRGDVYFILENWATHLKISVPADWDFLKGKGKKKAAKKDGKSTLMDELEEKRQAKQIEKMEKHALEMEALDMEEEVLRKREQLLQRQAMVEAGRTPVQEVVVATVKRTIQRQRLDEKGKAMWDGEEPVIEIVEEEIPVDAPGAQTFGQPPPQDPMDALLRSIKVVNAIKGDGGGGSNEGEIAAKMETMMATLRADGIEREAKLMAANKEVIDALKDELRETRHQKEITAITREFDDKIISLEGEIHRGGVERERDITPEEREWEIQKELVTDGGDRADKALEATREEIRDLGTKLVTGVEEERAHRRFLERITRAKELGIDPKKVSDDYESERIPDTSDDEMRELLVSDEDMGTKKNGKRK